MKSDRINQIQELVEKYGKISYDELHGLLPHVSQMTLRRDVSFLEEQGVLVRIPNGAVSMEEIQKKTEEQFIKRVGRNVLEKKEIAEKAMTIIKPKSCIFIDGGSTTLYFAKDLPNDSYYVVTNSLNVATEVLKNSLPTVALLGGDVTRNNLITIGQSSLDFLDKINIEVAVMTSTGFLPKSGCFTCGSQPEVDIKSRVIKKASKVVMLLDSTKVNLNTPYTFANYDDIDYLVVDSNFPKELREEIKNKNIMVI
ncbi:MAG: DeoR/GlpR transcriptional regulator [Clostridia bacterium]|nr:DeoR/GlpR transcriptional regulator [Clostridia bacterium]